MGIRPISTKLDYTPLFFEGLNNPFNQEVTSIDPNLRSLIGSVPFLNGGLFEKTELDESGWR